MRMTHRIPAVAASVAVLVGAPATVSAHEIDGDAPHAIASDGHYIVSLTWNYFECPAGYLCGDMLPAPTCVWSDGTVDYCDFVPWWNW